MENNNKPEDVTSDINKNASNKKATSLKEAITVGLLGLIIGWLCLYGYLKFENTIVRMVLYITATMISSFSFFGIVDVLTPKANSNYSMAAMLVIWSASLIYISTSTDISVLHWVYLIAGLLLLFIAIISFIIQVSKDIRKNSTLKRIIKIILILSPSPFIAELLALPMILCVIPFTVILLYNQYLRTTFLSAPIKETQSNREVSDKSLKDIKAPFRSLRNLRNIRPGLYAILIIFYILFLFMVTRQSTVIDDISLFYEVVVSAYLGILAIVIAFAVIIIRKESNQTTAGHLKLAILGLAQMYVFFALVTVAGLLMGTEVNGEILTQSIKISEIPWSVNTIFNFLRLFILEFAVLAFPAGLWYLRAMIQDFIRQ